VTLVNNTQNTMLIKVGEDLAHGEWRIEPPDNIGPGSQVTWESQSNGFLTGTEGWVRYYPVDANSDNVAIPSPVPDSDTIYVYWDNPFVGSNSYNTTATDPYQVTQQGDGHGDNTDVGFTLAGVYGPNTCFPGYVWRLAFPGDLVCVPPETRDQVASDNNQAASRKDPNGPYGPDSCVVGYVWRVASPEDLVCVPPETRDQVAYDNSHAARRIV